MLPHLHSIRSHTVLALRLVCVLFLLVSCTGQAQVVSPSNGPSPEDRVNSLPHAEVTFTAILPHALAENQSLYVEILDEVTGLALNPTRVHMDARDQKSFSTVLKFPVGSLVKYRYIRDNDPAAPIEYTTRGQQVRYRLYYVDGPGTALDVISAWRNAPTTANLGRIQGQVSAVNSNAPLVNALVTAGGLQTFTASDGTFLLEGLPPGTHNMVVYSLDGSYQVFQQGAVVAPNSTTPAFIQTLTAQLVNVTFIVKPPEGNLKGVPVRLIGNIYSLGNTFADLRGGVSVTASRAPLMTVQDDGSYMLTLKLPTGLDLRYKYTLGDGFWNAEHTTDGKFRVRQLIVPKEDVVINETIDTWTVNGIQPITFTVNIPPSTPINDVISIQFNPYGWTEPLPMWPLGSNRWFFILYSPLHLLKEAGYRFCRSEQCGIADASDTRGTDTKGKIFNATSDQKTYEDTVSEWAFLGSTGDPIVLSPIEITSRGTGFVAGAEFVPGYHPSWQPYVTWAFQNLRDIGSNTVMLSPTWRWTYENPPVIEAVTGQDPMWIDISAMNNQARQRGLEVILHPVGLISGDANTWWTEAARDANWWQSWFDRYETFMIYHADLASQMGAKALVIGDDSMLPALPGGTLADGSPSGVPDSAIARWERLIQDVRARYSGKLIWMLPVSGDGEINLPEFAGSADELYVRVSAPLFAGDAPSRADLEAGFSKLLDEKILPIQEKTGQPVLLGLLYPSATGAAAGCVAPSGTCLPLDVLRQPAIDTGAAGLAFQEQAEIYNAALTNLNQRSWISGLVASGYYPTTGLKDASTSVRSKPAADVLWYWFPRLTGVVAP